MAQRRVERTVVEGKGDDICTEESNRVSSGPNPDTSTSTATTRPPSTK
jgi:hypothetical protein